MNEEALRQMVREAVAKRLERSTDTVEVPVELIRNRFANHLTQGFLVHRSSR